MAKKQSKFDENGKSREADLRGRYTYRWHALPESHFAESSWKKFGYKPKDKNEFACWVLSGDNSNDYKIYNREQVTEISGKDAAARRELFHKFDGFAVRLVYTWLLSLMRKKRSRWTAQDEIFFFLCELQRVDVLKQARTTHNNRRDLYKYGSFFMGWGNKPRYTKWRNKNVDRLRNIHGGFWHPNATRAIDDFDKRIRSQWQ